MKFSFESPLSGIRTGPTVMRVLELDKLGHKAMELFQSIFQAEVNTTKT